MDCAKNKIQNNRILKIKTSQAAALKQAFERINNVISDMCIVFLPIDDNNPGNQVEEG